MKIVLCYTDNRDSNITSHNKYVKVKPRGEYTEQVTEGSSEQKHLNFFSWYTQRETYPKHNSSFSEQSWQFWWKLFLNKKRFIRLAENLSTFFHLHKELHRASSTLSLVSNSISALATNLCCIPHMVMLWKELSHFLVISSSHLQYQLFTQNILNMIQMFKPISPSSS